MQVRLAGMPGREFPGSQTESHVTLTDEASFITIPLHRSSTLNRAGTLNEARIERDDSIDLAEGQESNPVEETSEKDWVRFDGRAHRQIEDARHRYVARLG